jgi:hypothetical protein
VIAYISLKLLDHAFILHHGVIPFRIKTRILVCVRSEVRAGIGMNLLNAFLLCALRPLSFQTHEYLNGAFDVRNND